MTDPPNIIYARPAGNGCGWWYPQNDGDTPYIRVPDDCDLTDAMVTTGKWPMEIHQTGAGSQPRIDRVP